MTMWSYLTGKPWLLQGARFIFGSLLIFWLIHSGALDFEPLRSISLLRVVECIVLGAAITAILTVRTRMLLRDQQVRVSYRRCFAISCVGLFYSLFLPGGVSGDAAKAFYLFKDAPNRRVAVLGALFLDRFLGLVTLIALGLISGAFLVSVIPGVLTYLFGFGALLIALLFGLFWVMGQSGSSKRVTVAEVGVRTIRSRIHSLLARLQLDDYSTSTLVKAALLSLLMNAITILLIYECSLSSDSGLGLMKVAAVSPLGLLTNAVPLSPGGLGVGEKSFDLLYSAVGGQHGAVAFLTARIFHYFPAIFGGVVAIYALIKGYRPADQQATIRDDEVMPNSRSAKK